MRGQVKEEKRRKMSETKCKQRRREKQKLNETVKEKKGRWMQGGGSSELQKLSLSRVVLFNLPISVAPLWLKIDWL